jgi:hypothetical protein
MARTLVIGLAVAGLAGLVAAIGLAAPAERPDLGEAVLIEPQTRPADDPASREARPRQRDAAEPGRRDDAPGVLGTVDADDAGDDPATDDAVAVPASGDAVAVPVEVASAPGDAGTAAGNGAGSDDSGDGGRDGDDSDGGDD